MSTVISITFIIAAISLSVLILNLINAQSRAGNFQWHRSMGRDQFFIRVLSKKRPMTTLTLHVDDKLSAMKIESSRENYYNIFIPPKTTLNELHDFITSKIENDETVLALFGCIKTRKALDQIFTGRRDKKSCIEMFSYLKESLLYR